MYSHTWISIHWPLFVQESPCYKYKAYCLSYSCNHRIYCVSWWIIKWVHPSLSYMSMICFCQFKYIDEFYLMQVQVPGQLQSLWLLWSQGVPLQCLWLYWSSFQLCWFGKVRNGCCGSSWKVSDNNSLKNVSCTTHENLPKLHHSS